jgi:DNA invertase Pin-like site-specific DNA recombinase
MPKVGKKHYPYTHAGRRAAKDAAKKKGKKVRYTESTYERIIKLLFERRELQSAEAQKAAMSGLHSERQLKKARKVAHRTWKTTKDDEATTKAFLHALKTPEG